MVSRITTIAFEGIEGIPIEVQCQFGNGLPAFNVVGLADKAVTESRERVRSALSALGLALPPKRITVNLAPADRAKEGSHYDLPIALALLTGLEILPTDLGQDFVAIGELALDGGLAPVSGALAAAIAAHALGKGLICPATQGAEAAWSGARILAPSSLLGLINHVKGRQILSAPAPLMADERGEGLDLKDVKGQENAKRALEIAAAGNHNLLMIGPPGSGKSMLAARLPGLMPPLAAEEALEVSLIHSLAALLPQGRLMRCPPYRAPHHSASAVAMVGGGKGAKPGEISLAHRGVLFLDEFPEFPRSCLESLRQPLENGAITIARAQSHVCYPARFLLVAAMNPCKCGYLGDLQRQCRRAPTCGSEYSAKLSGPLLDRIDLTVGVAPLHPRELTAAGQGESSAAVAARVATARERQRERYARLAPQRQLRCNAEADGTLLTEVARLNPAAQNLLDKANDRLRLSARGYHRILRVARTIADLAVAGEIGQEHIAEALSYRDRFIAV
jgi:magnesium chelatase family protein